MLKTALRNVLAHKARLLMTVLAVCLGVAFISGTLVFGETSTAAHRAAASANYADTAVRISPKPPRPGQRAPKDTSPVLDDALVARLAGLSGVSSVRPSIYGSAVLNAADGSPLRSDDGHGNRADAWLPGQDGNDPRFPVVKGHAPRSADEIAVDSTTAARGKLALGNTVTLATDGPVMTKHLVGIVTTKDTRITSGDGTLTLFDKATARRLFSMPGYSSIDLTATRGVSDDQLARRVTARLPADHAEVRTGSALTEQQNRHISVLLRGNEKIALSYAVVALFIGSFLIVNTFTMLVARRSREIALLRAIGAARRQVVRALLCEATLTGLVSSALGFVLGLGIATAMPRLMTVHGKTLPTGPLVIGPVPVLAALFVGVGITVLAAWLPSRKASKIAPVEAMRTSHQPPPAARSRLRAIAGLLLSFGGAALLISLSAAQDASDENLQNAMLGAALLGTGLLLLAPTLAGPTIRAAGRLTTRTGVTGRLARDNALHDPRRTAATASALFVSTALVAALATIGHSSAQALDRQAADGLTADYLISTEQTAGIDPATIQRIARTPGVRTASAIADSPLPIGKVLNVTGVDPATLTSVLKLDFVTGSLTGLKPGSIAVSETTARTNGLKTGSKTTTAPGPDRANPTSYTVIGVYRDNPTAPDAIGDRSEIQHLNKNTEYFQRVLVSANTNGLSKTELLDATGNNPLLKIQSRDDVIQQAAGAMGPLLSMLYALLLLGSAISALAIANTLALSIADRTREIGTLRALGMHRAGIRSMIRLEALTVAAFGTALGLAGGIFGAWTVGSLANGSIKQYTFSLPWGTLLLTCLLSLTAGALAAALPARRAANLSPLEAIAES
ncbi:FtsX-like permease family protein [Streptomyces sp. NPDC017529]|uniref:FtsX-like permease family protein n=1 Tax=Streptomyces sp. NPDC017529 TaxID=3365000 RepID=UPI003787A0D9